MTPVDLIGMDAWVSEGPEDQREFREAVHVVIAAGTRDPGLREFMVMKGGLLMGIRYHSPRFTTDIDFSSSLSLSDLDPERLRRSFDAGMAMASAGSESNLECRVQSLRINPPNRPDASFPSIELNIGYAYKGTPKHRRLMQGQSPSVLSIDLSLNETIVGIDALKIDGDDVLLAYSINDLVAEKIRSLLQQTIRNRYRRQDVFDLHLLLNLRSDGIDPKSVLQSLREKARSRGIEVRPDSLDDPEVKRRAFKDYHTLESEVVGTLPDFELAYDGLLTFYKSLPW